MLARVDQEPTGTDDRMTAYQILEQRFSRLAALEGAAGILGWDAQTLMPDGAAEARGDQLAILRGLAHEILTAPETRGEIDAAEAAGGLDPWPAANLREMRRTQAHGAAVPRDLVEASSRAVSRSEMVWREARRDADRSRAGAAATVSGACMNGRPVSKPPASL